MDKVSILTILVTMLISFTWQDIQSGTRNVQFSNFLNIRNSINNNKKRETGQTSINFGGGAISEDGRLCVLKEDTIETMVREPILKCDHKSIRKCHVTYVTFFSPSQEQKCDEIFNKKCQITFRKEASREIFRKCYTPLVKVCNGQGPEECRTVWESSCTTRYVEKTPGNFIADTKCKKFPKKFCGQGCVAEEATEECHDKNIDSLVDIPEEECHINPQKTCHHVTKLTPSLRPKEECTDIPTEVCSLTFSPPKIARQPLMTEWCKETMDATDMPIIPPVTDDDTQDPSYNDSTQKDIVSEEPPSSYEAVRQADLLNMLEKLKRFGNILSL